MIDGPAEVDLNRKRGSRLHKTSGGTGRKGNFLQGLEAERERVSRTNEGTGEKWSI